MIFRHQVYLEGLKIWFALQYAMMLKNLWYRFGIIFNNAGIKTLDELSRSQLNEYLRLFQREQAQAYNSYIKKLMKALKDFIGVDVDMSTEIFQSLDSFVRFDGLFGTVKPSKLWDEINKEPMPANGKYPTDNIDEFTKGAMNSVLAIVRQGYANNFSPQQTVTMILGNDSSTFKDGLFARLVSQNTALMATIIQHLSVNTQSAVASTYYDKYQWISVMDTHTTEICIQRNGKVYVYGKGPLPPAWYQCRSHVNPLIGDPNELPSSFKSWLSEQPSDFQQFVANKQALSLNDFENKMKSILQ